MDTLGRIVIITTLTKQAIRSILELTQPADDVYGNPFIPIKACIVDTIPKAYGFDIVMSMERRTMRNILKVSPVEPMSAPKTTPSSAAAPSGGLVSKSKQMAAMKYQAQAGGGGGSGASATAGGPPYSKKGVPLKFIKGFKPNTGYVPGGPGKKFFPNPSYNPAAAAKFQQQGKRSFPGSEPPGFHPGAKKFKQFEKPWQGNVVLLL